MHRTSARLIAAAAAALTIAACSPPPETPPINEPPEPQASALADAVQAPIERARAVEDTLQGAADAQRQAIDAAVP